MHHKRKKARSRARSNVKSMSSWPKWWDVLFHTRPRRREEREIEKKLLKGDDPDSAIFPPGNHKPHNYYW